MSEISWYYPLLFWVFLWEELNWKNFKTKPRRNLCSANCHETCLFFLTKRHTLNDREANIDIIRSGHHELNDKKDIHEARIYKGDENFLEYSRSYEMVFKCFYNLQNYPFDSQECSIDLKIPAHQMELMQIHPDNFNNNGTFKLE